MSARPYYSGFDSGPPADAPTMAEVLRAARELYASAPAHCPVGQFPAPGTHCPITACNVVDRFEGAAWSYIADYVTYGDCARRQSLPALDAAHTTAHVLWAFDRAIARAEGREPVAPRYRIAVFGDTLPSHHDDQHAGTWSSVLARWRICQQQGLTNDGDFNYRIVQVS